MNPINAPRQPGWRTFDSLDIENPRSKTELRGRLSQLDLAEPKNKEPATVSARKIEEYSQRSAHDVRGPLFPAWAKSMPKYSEWRVTDSTANAMNCETAATTIQDVVKDIRQGVDYNGLNVVNEFIRFCAQERQKNPKLNDVELFHRFQPNSRDEAARTHGTSCVGKAWDIVSRLKELSMEAHVIVESSGPDDPPTHAAVAIPCTDGVLLIDIEWDVPVKIIKPNVPDVRIFQGDGSKSNPDLRLSFEIIEVPGNYRDSTPVIVKRETYSQETATKKNTYAQFVLRPESDPDLTVMKRWLVSSHTWFYPVSAATKEGREAHSFQLNIAQDKLTFNIGDKKFRIPLSAFDLETGRIDRTKLLGDEKLNLSPDKLEEYRDFILGRDGLGGTFFNAFNTPKELLLGQIANIVANKAMLNELRNSARSQGL